MNISGIRIGTRFQQRPDDREPLFLGSEMKCGVSVFTAMRIDVGARPDEPPRNLQKTVEGGPYKWRNTVPISRIHIDGLSKQVCDFLLVSIFRRVKQGLFERVH